MAACRQSTISIRWINRHEQNRAIARFANGGCDFESSQNGEITFIIYDTIYNVIAMYELCMDMEA